ncbi:hypothetical protein CLV47_103104 [Antricoccus suffuscus]|uniref:Uncharacterized protein n=1 Tax=Antricoccus suffuscus TaxID=1629062 RepID=A0A2T1A415_9ACTN|nr:hypothetical protein [Antricoccus suffuscus]PRZ43048.1 hypothetical protein CLV47_103104 [Antricoccus suffuscus]
MRDLAERADDFSRAPVAAAVFVLADRGGLDADALANPALVTALASSAIADLTPWVPSPGSARLRAQVLEQVRPLRSLVNAVLADPRNTWWQQPAAGSNQVHLVDQRAAERTPRPDPMHLPTSAGMPGLWNVTYAQRPIDSVLTSTLLPVRDGEVIASGGHGELAYGWDADPIYPVAQTRLKVDSHARVYEITSAVDWHALALTYGDPETHPGPDRSLLNCGGIDHGLAPTWNAVTRDYDGVHLTFAGLLSALFVPVRTGAVSTTLWNWTSECTCWLRTAFTSSTPSAELPTELEAPEMPRLW